MTSRKARRHRSLQNQIARLNRRLYDLHALSSRFTNYRVATFFAGLAIGILCYYFLSEELGWVVIAATSVVFNIVAFFHRRILRSATRHKIWLALKSSQLARMDLNWEKIPVASATPPNVDHPFELDLDITGKKSLHHLIDVALSRQGSARLHNWLLTTHPDLEEIKPRQQIVRELAPLARFRDKLSLTVRLIAKDALDGNKLLAALTRSKSLDALSWLLPVSSALCVINIALFVFDQLALIPPWWIVSLIVYGVIYFLNERLYESMMDDVVEISDELVKLNAILKYLESYPMRPESRLHEVCRPIRDFTRRPSSVIRRVAITATAIGLRMNPMMRLILNVALPWDFYLARLLDQLRKDLAGKLPQWLDAIYELEAATSLANFAYLNPDYAFPEFIAGGSALLSAKQLGHPLIPDAQHVGNDFTFSRLGDIALITGSNMSGKSTFLKTVGINLALAFAGGPVVAENFQTATFRIFACIQINDSVTDGFSFFYAEVRRLKRILDELHKDDRRPLLFLIDEIFKGTNNRERLIGSEAYIRELAGKHGVGAISTHDLELTKLADSIRSLTNYHFREEVVAEKMEFDFKLRQGPCPTTNALKIMQLAGLPVSTAAEGTKKP
jgi:hypothetical protein